MTHTTEPTIDLYQKITDICFENGGVTKPMVDKLHNLISDQVAKARLTQLERLYKNGTITKQAWDYESAILEDNIATLNGVKNK